MLPRVVRLGALSRGQPWLWSVYSPRTQNRAASTKRTSKKIQESILVPTYPTAQKLLRTGVWRPSPRKGRDLIDAPKAPRVPRAKVKGDKTRVNVVSDDLCNDLISYIGSSLERHKGCDLIDLYPGAGLWSRKLHEFLQPRSHILMEPDFAFYKPFLQPLIDKPNTMLLAKSGIVWKDLNSILTPEYLPHQKVVDRFSDEANKQNDTLLVTCNIAFHPKKRFKGFSSVANLVLQQFIESIKSSTLFQRYGRVRMLIWVRRDDKGALKPRCIQKYKRSTLMNGLFCDSLHELVDFENPEMNYYARDEIINRASAVATLNKMRANNIVTPLGRETEALKQALKDSLSPALVVPGIGPPEIQRPFQKTLDSLLESDPDRHTNSEDWHQKQKYSWRRTFEAKRTLLIHSLQQRAEKLTERRQAGETGEELQHDEQALETELSRLKYSTMSDLTSCSDNLNAWRQEPPLLHWDRRTVEPLVADVDEFFPNVECTLLDIQPGAVHPLFRQVGQKSDRTGDSFELIAQALWGAPTVPVAKTLESVWPGAADYIIPRCHSFHDPALGGVNLEVPSLQLTTRMMNARHWEDLMNHWREWPFKPEFHELVARSQDEQDEDDGAALLEGAAQ